MAKTIQKRRIVGNPGGRAFGKKYKRAGGGARAGHHRRTNTGAEIVGYTLAGNPGRRGTMAKTKKKYKKATAHRGSSKKYKGNPGRGKHHAVTHHKKYRRNTGGMGGGVGSMVTNAAFAILGAIGSKLGAQMILGSNNTGVVGYAGNAGIGFGLWLLFEKMFHNRAAATGIATGTVIQLILRAINDYTPFGQYVAQLGMGDYQMQSFVTPQVLVDPLNSAEIDIPGAWAPKMIAPAPPAAAATPAGKGMGGLYGGGGFGGSRGGLYSV